LSSSLGSPERGQPVVSKYERALYGALSGDLQSVLPACETWEDQLWAHVNHLLETRIDAHIAAAPAFFSKRAIAPDAAAPASKDLKADLAAAFDSMLQAPKEQIQQEARHPLRMAQSYVIQDQSDELIETFVDRLEGAGDDVDEVCVDGLLWDCY
jgi:nuclear pore complex protein Nup107